MGRLLLLVWAAYSQAAIVIIKGKISIKITPNPSINFIMISMNANLNPATIGMFDAGGRLVFNKKRNGGEIKSIFKNFSNNRVFHTDGRLFQGGL